MFGDTIPSWSGEFVLTSEGDQGTISVVYADLREPRPPDGWTLIEIVQDTEENSETYVYRRA